MKTIDKIAIMGGVFLVDAVVLIAALNGLLWLALIVAWLYVLLTVLWLAYSD